MNIEKFTDKVLGKVIGFRACTSQGGLTLTIETKVNKVEDKPRNGYYCWKINDDIELIFDNAKVCEEFDCEHLLLMYRDDEASIEISLPISEVW